MKEATIAALISEHAEKYPDKTAFIFDNHFYSWRQVDRCTDRIAAGMLKKGIIKGTHLGFWSMNHAAAVFYLLAAMKIGVVCAVINYSYHEFELKNVLQEADIEFLYLGEYKKGLDYRAMVQAVGLDCPKLRCVEDMLPVFESLFDPGAECETAPEDKEMLEGAKMEVGPEDVLVITFTSGTTMVPKMVMLTQRSVIFDVTQFTRRMRIGPDDILLAPLPLFHSSGISGMLVFAVVTGITAVIHHSFIAKTALKDIERYKVTAILAVPSMLELLIRDDAFEAADVSSLRVVQSSGSAVTVESLRRIMRKLGIRHLLMGYGQTECSPLVTMTLYEDDERTMTETVGCPLCGVRVRIWDKCTGKPAQAICRSMVTLDEEAGCEAATGRTGEIQVCGPNVMKGYYKNESENLKKFTSDGWLKTGDAGFMDERGYLHFVARISDIIIRHGENISPLEIEYVVEQSDKNIIKAKAVGVQSEIVQEDIACFVQVKEEAFDPEAIKACVRRTLASFKVPKYVFRVDSFPITGTGKIDQAALKRLAEKLVGDRKLEAH